MRERKKDNSNVLLSLDTLSLDTSLTEDLLTEAYSAAEISDSLGALGADPDAIGRRGIATVAELLNERGLGEKNACDGNLLSGTHAPIAWSPPNRSLLSQNWPKGGDNRSFEFTQMLRAYRFGVISSSQFERSMSYLEMDASPPNIGFQMFGNSYASEREAVIKFLETLAPAEAAGEDAIRGWLRVCKLESIKGGLKMIAERESYHARAFAQRLLELGGSPPRTLSEEMRRNIEFLSDPNRSDMVKLEHGAKRFREPEEAIRPLFAFADCLEEDLQTKEMVKLFAQDELSSLKWQSGLCAELTTAHQIYGPLGVRA